jgi:hypothetical protein
METTILVDIELVLSIDETVNIIAKQRNGTTSPSVRPSRGESEGEIHPELFFSTQARA